MPTDPSYCHKNAGSWQISPSVPMAPLHGSWWTLNDASLCPTQTRLRSCSRQVFLPRVDGAFLTVKVSCPAVASASSSVSPSRLSPPPSKSSAPERESNMKTISVTGPGDDPATRRCFVRTTAKQTQHEKSRTATSRCALSPLTIGTYSRVSPLLLLQVPPDAPRSRNPVYPRYMSKTPPFLPSPSKSNSSEPHPQCDRDRNYDPLNIISVNSSSSSPPPPPWAACARPINGGDRGN
ncbi:hypothetical protein EDB85DRAFT_1923995 [Lactarius pseudohatsudake]|nr:hypothetical protein EDB85DRAFT_1923995 [Lactarius pseudohatsudake]